MIYKSAAFIFIMEKEKISTFAPTKLNHYESIQKTSFR